VTCDEAFQSNEMTDELFKIVQYIRVLFGQTGGHISQQQTLHFCDSPNQMGTIHSSRAETHPYYVTEDSGQGKASF
jgi:hypothetical protein